MSNQKSIVHSIPVNMFLCLIWKQKKINILYPSRHTQMEMLKCMTKILPSLHQLLLVEFLHAQTKYLYISIWSRCNTKQNQKKKFQENLLVENLCLEAKDPFCQIFAAIFVEKKKSIHIYGKRIYLVLT